MYYQSPMGLQILNSGATLRLVVQFWKGNIEWMNFPLFLQFLMTFIQSYHEAIKPRRLQRSCAGVSHLLLLMNISPVCQPAVQSFIAAGILQQFITNPSGNLSGRVGTLQGSEWLVFNPVPLTNQLFSLFYYYLFSFYFPQCSLSLFSSFHTNFISHKSHHALQDPDQHQVKQLLLCRILIRYLLSCSRATVPAQIKVVYRPTRFYMDVWFCFTVQNGVLDVSRSSR